MPTKHHPVRRALNRATALAAAAILSLAAVPRAEAKDPSACFRSDGIITCFSAYRVTLRSFHHKQIRELAAKIVKSHRAGIDKITVVGHSASYPPKPGNPKAAAAARARNVYGALWTELRRQGFDPRRLTWKVYGMSDRRPMTTNTTHTGRALNRRVEVIAGRRPSGGGKTKPSTPDKPAPAAKDPIPPHIVKYAERYRRELEGQLNWFQKRARNKDRALERRLVAREKPAIEDLRASVERKRKYNATQRRLCVADKIAMATGRPRRDWDAFISKSQVLGMGKMTISPMGVRWEPSNVAVRCALYMWSRSRDIVVKTNLGLTPEQASGCPARVDKSVPDFNNRGAHRIKRRLSRARYQIFGAKSYADFKRRVEKVMTWYEVGIDRMNKVHEERNNKQVDTVFYQMIFKLVFSFHVHGYSIYNCYVPSTTAKIGFEP